MSREVRTLFEDPSVTGGTEGDVKESGNYKANSPLLKSWRRLQKDFRLVLYAFQNPLQGWKDDLVVKSTGPSSRGPGFEPDNGNHL